MRRHHRISICTLRKRVLSMLGAHPFRFAGCPGSLHLRDRDGSALETLAGNMIASTSYLCIVFLAERWGSVHTSVQQADALKLLGRSEAGHACEEMT